MILILSMLLGCTDGSNAKKVLMNQGYEDIEITGYRFWGCSEDDWYHTGFKAKSSSTGNYTSGIVCQGLVFKGSTIRFD